MRTSYGAEIPLLLSVRNPAATFLVVSEVFLLQQAPSPLRSKPSLLKIQPSRFSLAGSRELGYINTEPFGVVAPPDNAGTLLGHPRCHQTKETEVRVGDRGSDDSPLPAVFCVSTSLLFAISC